MAVKWEAFKSETARVQEQHVPIGLRARLVNQVNPDLRELLRVWSNKGEGIHHMKAGKSLSEFKDIGVRLRRQLGG